jgi:hypothetical protein
MRIGGRWMMGGWVEVGEVGEVGWMYDIGGYGGLAWMGGVGFVDTRCRLALLRVYDSSMGQCMVPEECGSSHN